MRAPLAFLLGRLEFSRDFKDFQQKTENGETVITAVPKSDKLPYTQVTFALTSKLEISRLIVTGQDQSVLEFQFSKEIMNPVIPDSAFRFQPPKGAEVVDSSGQ
jgi:outer membrane lipoprotein carrier protein